MAHWIYLFIAIAAEVVGTTCMKLSEGLSKFWPSVSIFAAYGISFVALTLCLKKIDVSIAYAVWSGLGTAIIAVIGFLMFGETITAMKLLSFGLIIAGCVGLNLS
jgi:small multidrug resistance pump